VIYQTLRQPPPVEVSFVGGPAGAK